MSATSPPSAQARGLLEMDKIRPKNGPVAVIFGGWLDTSRIWSHVAARRPMARADSRGFGWRWDRIEALELPFRHGMLFREPVRLLYSCGPLMTDENDKCERNPARDSRQDRLKQALRENLKRRKLQARERSQSETASDDDEPSLRERAADKGGT